MIGRLLLLSALLSATAAATAQTAAAQPHEGIAIREVVVAGQRPLKEIGVQQTRIDSAALQENIALSIADVLTFNSPLFVKSYGRATLSTASFRGTGASHTQVTWNGMRIDNPMLGMTDFSTIPAYFIDAATLLHGTSSVNDTGGGLGGSVRLATEPVRTRGWGLQYIQGAGSFRTFDEFLRLTYGNGRWQSSTRIACSSSPNDYKYRNRDKKENIYDDQHQIIGQYYPVERNRSGAFTDLHVLQEVYCNTGRGDRWGLNAWYLCSDRELAMLTTDYGTEADFENRQRERTFRGIVSWDHVRRDWKLGVKAGYIHTWMAYDYRRDNGSGELSPMTRSRSKVDTFYGRIEGEYAPNAKWLLTADISAHQHMVESADRNIILQEGDRAVVGYDKARIELSAAFSAKWRPTERIGLSAVLREELYGTERTPPIPAFFADILLSRRGNLMAKASVSRNCRFPTLNDLYFLPGGNPDLRSERGLSYEAGLSFAVSKAGKYALSGSASWYDQHIDDWILWLPTTKGFFSPVNMQQVHAYGIELQADLSVTLSRQWRLAVDGTFSWSPSINEGAPLSPDDLSAGRQLPYEPEYSATLSGRLTWRGWGLLCQWRHYSERYTMSSNDRTLTGRLAPYYMNNLSLEKNVALRWAELSFKGMINNLFDEEYLSMLSHPMPGIHFEIFVGIRPRWGKKQR